jgi:hypothetical protein
MKTHTLTTLLITLLLAIAGQAHAQKVSDMTTRTTIGANDLFSFSWLDGGNYRSRAATATNLSAGFFDLTKNNPTFTGTLTGANAVFTGTFTMGTASATPTAKYLRGQPATGTDIAGGEAWLVAGTGTGTGGGGNLVMGTAYAGITGTGANTEVARSIIVAKGKALTDAAAVSLFEIALPSLSMTGGTISATIQVTNGTDMQAFSQTIGYSAVNKAGTYTYNITADTGNKSVSAGTLTTTWSILNGTNKVTIQLNADTSLTPSGTNSFVVYYQVRNNSQQAITTL